eukprot:COSAG06_NODE_11442_length_1509_cov_1.891489_2_plen_179_part_00
MVVVGILQMAKHFAGHESQPVRAAVNRVRELSCALSNKASTAVATTQAKIKQVQADRRARVPSHVPLISCSDSMQQQQQQSMATLEQEERQPAEQPPRCSDTAVARASAAACVSLLREMRDSKLPAALLAELQPLAVRELRERAVAAGVDAEVLEEARDGHNPKQDIIQLLLRAAAGA